MKRGRNMRNRRAGQIALSASVLAASAGTAGGQTAPAPEAALIQPAARTDDILITGFNFSETPFDQVLDFFSRQSGLPIIREAPSPQASMTFLSTESYTFDQALTILNLNLHMHNVHLRKQGEFLYLATITDSVKRAGEFYSGTVPAEVPRDRIVTVSIPLSRVKADVVHEQIIKNMVGTYGASLPVIEQNMLIVVETVEQIRRIEEVLRTIDSVAPVDSEFRVFKLLNAKPDAVVAALQGLVGERVKQIIIDQNGKQRIVEENTVPGLNIQPDARTNSVIAVGPKIRLDTIADLIQLLDAEGGGIGAEREMRTFSLSSISAGEAATSLTSLFQGVPDDRKPTILALPDVGKVTIVAAPSLLLQATALIKEIDPGTGGEARVDDRVTRRVELRHVSPDDAQRVADRLLSPRQKQVLRAAATPDQKSLLVSGPESDVEAYGKFVALYDSPAPGTREIRIIEVVGEQARDALARAQELHKNTQVRDGDAVTVTLDAEGGTATLMGTRAALGSFESVLSQVRTASPGGSETRTYTLKGALPSVVGPKVARMAPALAVDDESRGLPAPVVEPLDELRTLVVRAHPDQFAVVEQLVERFDSIDASARQFRVMSVKGSDPKALVARAGALYEEATKGANDPELEDIDFSFDDASGKLILKGSGRAIAQFTSIIEQAQQLLPPERTTRFVDVRNVSAADIVKPLQELLASADPIDPARALPEPEISVSERTNSLLITAEPAQHTAIADFVRRLDVLDQSALPPLKLLQLRAADANSIAAMLSQQYSGRPQKDRAERPVDVRADAATNTLIVSAHPDLFDEIRSFVDDINRQDANQPERVTLLIPLKVAKAVDVASAMDRLYPVPPVPRDARGRELWHLQKPKEVTVSADASSNSLIIDAPLDREESLRELAAALDRVELPPAAQVRTYRVTTGDINRISQTFQSLVRSGVITTEQRPGQQQIRVTIDVEPRSQTLIVAGDEVTFEAVELLLADLGQAVVERGLRIVPIANAAAKEVRERSLAIYNAQIEHVPGALAIEVGVDEESNSLEVVGDDEAMARFMRIIEELQRQVGPARELRSIELRFAKASEVIEFLDDLVKSTKSFRAGGGAEPVFEAIEATNTLLVAAQPGQFAIIESLVRGLDNSKTAERPPLRILTLRTTDSIEMARVLQESYNARPAEDRAKRPVEVRADPSTNSLIISAHADVYPEIESIVSELNERNGRDTDGRVIRIFPLREARAEELARTIDEMFPQPPVPRDNRGRELWHLQEPKEVFVRADPFTNSLIVDAPAQRLDGFEQIVSELDKQKPASEIEIRTYRVGRADLNAAATTIRDLAGKGAFGQTGRAPINVTTEPVNRTLVVSGPVSIFEHVERVLDELKSAPDSTPTSVRIYTLSHTRADTLQPLLQDLLVTRLREQDEAHELPEGELRSLLHVASDRASNTLIISAPEGVQKLAEELVKQLDSERTGGLSSTIRIVPLMYVEANAVSDFVRTAEQNADLGAGRPVTAIAIASANSVMLSGSDADVKRVVGLIEEIDVQPIDPERTGVETFTLEHAEATGIAATVQRLLQEQQQTDPRILRELMRNRGFLSTMQRAPIRVEADTRTNSLIVSGPEATLTLAREMIERLDQPAGAEDISLASFTPARGSPDRLAASVSKIIAETFPRGRRPVQITVDTASGALVVTGPKEQVAEAVRLLSDADDRALTVPASDVIVAPLMHADATAVAPTLQSILNDRTRWPDELTRAERAGLSIAAPSVRADASANRLIVGVPTPLSDLARELITSLDAQMGQGEREVRVFRLKKGDASGVAEALRASLGASVPAGALAPSITAEPSSNSVVISTTPEMAEKAAKLVAEMDDNVEPAGSGIRTILLKHARAEAVAPVVEQVFTGDEIYESLPSWERGTYLRQVGGKVDTGIKVAAEKRLNAVVISGPLPVLELAESAVRDLDVPPSGDDPSGRPVRVIPLKNADATQLAANIDAVFADAGATSETPPTVRVDQGSNSLIVRASSAQMKVIDDLASQLDSATLTTSRQMRTIRIDRSRADAAMLAETVRRLIQQQGGGSVEVISVDDLLEQGNEKSGDVGEKPAEKRSEVSPFRRPVGGWRVFQLKAIEPAFALAQSAQPETSQPEAGQPERKADPVDGAQDDPDVTIAVDPATNSLVLLGSPRMSERVAALVQQLQDQMPSEPTRVRVVTLPQTADADAIAGVIGQSINRIGRASNTNPGGFTGAAAVASDPDGGALIVWANDTDFTVIGQLIASIAKLETSGSTTIKVYPLVNVSAENARRAIQDMLTASPRGAQARRVRQMNVEILGDGGAVKGRLDPSAVRVSADAAGSSVVVSAPAEVIPVIDRLVGLLDQSFVATRLQIRRYAVENADADELARGFGTLFSAQNQGVNSRDLPRASFVAETRTNSLLVTASDDQHAEVARLLKETDVRADSDGTEFAIIPLQNVSPGVVEQAVRDVFVGRDPGRGERISMSASDESSMLIVRALPEDMAEIKRIVEAVDVSEAGGLPMRTIKLTRADAQDAATSISRFFQDRARASSTTGRSANARVAIAGDRGSGTLIIAASDDDFAIVSSMAQALDAAQENREWRFEYVTLKNASVTDLDDTIQNVYDGIYDDLTWGNRRSRGGASEESIYLDIVESTNSVVIVGNGEVVDTMISLIRSLDVAGSEISAKVVRAVRVDKGDLNAIAQVIESVGQGVNRNRWYWEPSSDSLTVTIDRARKMLLIAGPAAKADEAVAMVKELAEAGDSRHLIETVTLRHIAADRASQSLRQFFQDRSRATGEGSTTVSIMGSKDGNVLVVSAIADDMTLIRDLAAQMDQPNLGKERHFEIHYLRNADVTQVADTIRSLFPSTGREDDAVILVPQPSRSMLIVSSPASRADEIKAMIGELDALRGEDLPRLVTVSLQKAKAREVAEALTRTIQGSLKVSITPIERSNSLLVSGSAEAVEVVMGEVAKLDVEQIVQATEFRSVKLKNAKAFDVYLTVSEMVRARRRDQGDPAPAVDYSNSENAVYFTAPIEEIDWIISMVQDLDVATTMNWTTDWVKLEFAPAQQASDALSFFYGPSAIAARTAEARSVRIVTDPVTNSLLISASPDQWEDIKSLLQRIDSEEYDTERQLRVIGLRHADAATVARTLNEGLRAPLEAKLQQEQIRIREEERRRGNQNNQGDLFPTPTAFVNAEDVPIVSAEPRTNSLVIFAAPKLLKRIESIVSELDRSGFEDSDARIVAISNGRASQIAGAIREVFISQQPEGRRTVVYGDDTSNTLIVRASEADFVQVKALAESLQQRASATARVRVIALSHQPAARMKPTVERVFQPQSQRSGEPLVVEVDRESNALVVACSAEVFEQIKQLVAELDTGGAEGAQPEVPGAAAPISGAIRVVDLQNVAPSQMRDMLAQAGVTSAQDPTNPGIVAEPVRIVILTSRPAIALTGSSADIDAVADLASALDKGSTGVEQHMAIRRLKLNSADEVVRSLREILSRASEQGQPAIAQAIQEQIRRRRLVSTSVDKGDVVLDLAVPIRLIADAATNSVIVASTEANVRATMDLVELLDTLPVGDAVVVRFFPLTNASAIRTKSVIEELFRQGEALRRLPGTRRQGLPVTATGQALAGEIAVSVDERTNTMIVAGREEAVTLVEVMIQQIDSGLTSTWIEPVIVTLQHADARRLSETLTRVLVNPSRDGVDDGLRRQFARLALVQQGKDPSAPDAKIESDLFAPLTGLVIEPEEQLNALIVVGSPANVAVVKELARNLDVEAAAASNTVRIYPLESAAADRVAQTLSGLFREREQAGSMRPEDRVIIQPDLRTNSLIVTTSPGSFEIVESLVKKLDAAEAPLTVGVHVIAVKDFDASDLAPKIERIMRDRIDAATRSGAVRTASDVFSVQSDTSSNLLIVACSDENLKVVNQLVTALTSGREEFGFAGSTEVIPVRAGLVDDIAQKIQQLYVDRENQARGENSVTVVPDNRLSALLVRGTGDDVLNIRNLVASLDTAEVETVRELRRIELRSNDAQDIADYIRSVLVGDRGAAMTSQRAERIEYIREAVREDLEQEGGAAPTPVQIDAAIRSQISVIPDARSNSVTVVAPSPAMQLITEIISDMEESKNADRVIKHFLLTNASARQMSVVLRDIFSLRQQGNGNALLVPEGSAGPEGERLVDPDLIRLVPIADERRELAITVDIRTNSLIVSGTEEYVDRVAEIVEKLDSIRATDRHQLVYRLRNASAEEVETNLREYFDRESRTITNAAGPDQIGSLETQLENEITVVGDPKSNTVLVSASPRRIKVVEEIIRELDTAPPQVLVDVLLVEVTLDNENTWGVDLDVPSIGGDMFTFGALAAGAGVAAGVGVPNLQIASSDIEFMVRALEAQGRLVVLSRPNVTVRNNETSDIQVGQNVAIVEGFEILDNGNTRANVNRRDVGIIMEVTPSISPDGFVTMTITPEISAVSGARNQISENLFSDSIDVRRVSTVVTVKDGQTAVIGGLIQTRTEQRESKVPLLGDMPFAGYIFRSKRFTDVRTELRVLLTPRVIPGEPSDAVRIFSEITGEEIRKITPSEEFNELLPEQYRQKIVDEIKPPESKP